ncbi:MAG: NUDIX domain-containing protein [Nitrospirae bacterium]|nr:MAG: NUDIX domain-containing protein [Nitrospirota bacterium]
MQDELLEIVDQNGNVIATAPRCEIHGNPALLHRVVHVLVFNDAGDLLLQKRSMKKDVAPGKWDTSVGGHMSPGEDLITAAMREMEEELGVVPDNTELLYSYIHSNVYESELVNTYSCVHNGPFSFNGDEIDEVRFWRLDDIRNAFGSGSLSDNFEHEIKMYLGSVHKF